MILGVIISVAGTALLTRLNLQTTTVQWAAYLALTGFGIGVGMQLPFTALQVVLW